MARRSFVAMKVETYNKLFGNNGIKTTVQNGISNVIGKKVTLTNSKFLDIIANELNGKYYIPNNINDIVKIAKEKKQRWRNV